MPLTSFNVTGYFATAVAKRVAPTEHDSDASTDMHAEGRHYEYTLAVILQINLRTHTNENLPSLGDIYRN